MNTRELDRVEREIRESDREIAASPLARTRDCQTFQLARMLPPEWREMLRDMRLSRAENESVDRIVEALQSYRSPPPTQVTAEERIASWSKSNKRALVETIVSGLMRVTRNYERIEALLRRAMQSENESLARPNADTLARKVATLVSANVASLNAFNEFIAASDAVGAARHIEHTVEASGKYYEELQRMFPNIDERALREGAQYEPRLSARGRITLVMLSSVRTRRGARTSVDDDNDDSDDSDDDEEEEETQLARGGQPQAQEQRAELDTILFGFLWRAFQFLTWETASGVLSTAANLLIVFYQSGANETFVEQQYMSTNFKGYADMRDVSLETWLFGDYGMGKYGLVSARDQGGYKLVNAISFEWYNELKRFISRVLLETLNVAVPGDRSFVLSILTAVVVRFVVLKVLEVGVAGITHLYRHTLSRVRRIGSRARRMRRR